MNDYLYKRIDDFDEEIDNISENNLFKYPVPYPFIGCNFKIQEKKIIVFAHNIPIRKLSKEEELKMQNPKTFTGELKQYVKENKPWNKAFRYFIVASLNFKKDFKWGKNENETNEIGNFISKISHVNFIKGLIESETQNNVKIDHKIINLSTLINFQLISILGITHIVSWGKNVFNHIITNDKTEVLELVDDLSKIENLTKLEGFAFAKIKIEGKKINILKVFHPSMPKFKRHSQEVHNIFNWFYNL